MRAMEAQFDSPPVFGVSDRMPGRASGEGAIVAGFGRRGILGMGGRG